MRHLIALFAFLVPALLLAERVIVTDGSVDLGEHDYREVTISPFPSWAGLKEFSEATGTRPGQFPSLVDTRNKVWLFIATDVATTSAEMDGLIQAAKPQAQKAYENAFFDLIDELLVLVDDPQDPTPKLGFPEIQALIAQVQSVDPMAAVNLSLNLLTIDAALKRYDTMWWDNAIQHETPEE